MEKVNVINNTEHPEMLESGVIIPAAGTPQSKPLPVVLNALDRSRLVKTGKVSILPAPAEEPAPAETKHARRAAARNDE